MLVCEDEEKKINGWIFEMFKEQVKLQQNERGGSAVSPAGF